MDSPEKGLISYCDTCKDDREMIDPQTLKMPAGIGEQEIIKGTCPVCGSNLFVIPSGS